MDDKLNLIVIKVSSRYITANKLSATKYLDVRVGSDHQTQFKIVVKNAI